MMDNIVGQTRATSLLMKLVNENFQGRTLIFLGERGVGKFSTACGLARAVLKKNIFVSPDFQFYRNDDYTLKTNFFLGHI